MPSVSFPRISNAGAICLPSAFPHTIRNAAAKNVARFILAGLKQTVLTLKGIQGQLFLLREYPVPERRILISTIPTIVSEIRIDRKPRLAADSVHKLNHAF